MATGKTTSASEKKRSDAEIRRRVEADSAAFIAANQNIFGKKPAKKPK